MSATFDLNEGPDYDDVLQQIADYVLTYRLHRALAGLQRHLAGRGVGAPFG
jgi:hypothetical protein